MIRSIRNSRNGSSYLNGIANNSVRPFQYRNTVNRLLNRSRIQNQSFYAGGNNFIGNFSHMRQYYGFSSKGASSPINTGYNSGELNSLCFRNISQQNPVDTSYYDKNHIKQVNINEIQDVQKSLYRDKKLSYSKEAEQFKQENREVKPRTSTIVDTAVTGQRDDKIGGDGFGATYSKIIISNTKQNNKSPENLGHFLSNLGKQLEAQNYPESKSNIIIDHRHSHIKNPASHADLSIPGMTHKQQKVITTDDHSIERSQANDNYIVLDTKPRQYKKLIPAEQPSLNQSLHKTHKAEINHEISNIPPNSAYKYDINNDLINPLKGYQQVGNKTGNMATGFPNLNYASSVNKYKKQQNPQSSRITQVIHRKTTFKRPVRKITSSSFYLQRRYLGRAGLRIYK